MDPVTLRAATEVVAKTAEGGGTFEGSTLLPFKPKDGFAVGIGGARFPAHAFTAEVASWLLRACSTEYETTYVGTWLNGGTVHVDAVRYFAADRREAAIAAGYDAGQEAIYDFGAAESIYLDGGVL